MKKIWILAFGLLALTLAGCGIHHHNHDHQENEAPALVKIGVIAPLSGPNAGYWLDAVNVYQDRVNQFNQNHSDVQVELIIEDGKAEGPAAASAAHKLITLDNIDVLLGGRATVETMTAGPIAQENAITTLSVGATASSISEIGDYVYRFWNDALAVKKLANYLESKYQNIVVVYEKSSASKQEFYDEFVKTYSGHVLLGVWLDTKEKDYGLVVKQIQSHQDKLESILILGSEELTIGLIKEMKKTDLLKKFQSDIIGHYQMASTSLLAALGTGTLEGMKQMNVNMGLLKSEKGKEFITYFKEKYGVQGAETFLVFDVEGIDILLDAIKSGARTSEQFRSYIRSIDKNHQRSGFLWTFYFTDERDTAGLESAIAIQEIRDGIGVNID